MIISRKKIKILQEDCKKVKNNSNIRENKINKKLMTLKDNGLNLKKR